MSKNFGLNYSTLKEPNKLPMSFSFRSIFFIIISILTISSLHAQEQKEDTVILLGDSISYKPGKKVLLTGVITSPSLKPIIGAALFVDGYKNGNNSDVNGRYALNLPNGKYRLTVRYLGMKPIHKKIAIYENSHLDLIMEEKSETLEEVIVKARKENENVREILAGVTKLNITEIKRLPALMGEVDVIKSLQLLPGVSTVGEGSSGYNVRGGRIDQNLILMDGAQIFNSSHALGLLSNFNPDVVEDFTLYKGNVPAQFGGRASSVLDVRTRNGDFNKFKFKGGVGIISSRLAIEGPIIKNKLSFIGATRFSYSDWILKAVKNIDVRQSSASFYDINGNLTYKANKNNTFNLSYYLGHDYFRYSKEFGYEYSTQLLSFRWKSILSTHWLSELSAVSGDYKSKLYDFNITTARSLSNGIGYNQLKQNFLYSGDEKHAVNFGVDANLYNGRPEKSSPYGDNSSTISERVEKDKGREFGFYANEEWNITPSFSISAGLRYSLYQNLGVDTVYSYQPDQTKNVNSITDTIYYSSGKVINNYQGLEPRISARYGLGENRSIKISFNRMRQYIHLISNGTAPTPVDIWQVSNPHISPQIANNYSLGYFHNFKENTFETSAELFYKTIDNLVEYKDFAQLLLNRHLETELIQGKGKAYGIELYAKKNTGNWTGWISYTYARSFIKINGAYPEENVNKGNWYPTNYDKPNTVSLTANRKLGKKARFATNFTYSTGRPITALISNYQSGSTAIPIYSERNEYRIPDYWRLDISITFNSVFKKFDDNLSFSVYNLLGRRNAYSIYYQQPDDSAIPKAYKLSILGSALPSITYNFNF